VPWRFIASGTAGQSKQLCRSERPWARNASHERPRSPVSGTAVTPRVEDLGADD
jgi:hypothetical protein